MKEINHEKEKDFRQLNAVAYCKRSYKVTKKKG